MNKSEAAELSVMCEIAAKNPDRAIRIAGKNTQAALADRTALIEALKPFAECNLVDYYEARWRVDAAATRKAERLLRSMGELE